MTREQAQERLLDYAWGDLSPQEAAEFEAVLREDPELRAELESVKALRRAAASLPRPALPPAVREDLLRAARAEARRRATIRRWEEWRSFFLSPVFLAASAVIAAVGVGVHLITIHGTDDPWSRLDREQRRAALEAPAPVAAQAPAAAPAAETATTLPPPFADKPPAPASAPRPAEPTSGILAANEAAPEGGGTKAAGGPSREATPRKTAARDADFADALSGGLATGSAGLGTAGTGRGGGGGAPAEASLAAAEKKAEAPEAAGAAGERARREPVATAEPRLQGAGEQGKADGDRAATRSRDAAPAAPRGFATPPPARTMAQAPAPDGEATSLEDEAPAPAAARPSEEEASEGLRKEQAPDPAPLLDRARALREAGRLREALAAFRACLAAGPAGALLADALAEAAALALSLGEAAEAEGYLARLERLPGGPERAARIRAK